MNIRDFLKHNFNNITEIEVNEGDARKYLMNLGDEISELKDEYQNVVALYIDMDDDNEKTYIWDASNRKFSFISVNDFIDLKENEDNVDEATSSTSSGAYQTPFHLTEEKFNSLVKKALLLEYVYPSNSNTEKNTKNKKRPSSQTHTVNTPYTDKTNHEKLSDEEKDIEAHANGMEDLEYDYLPEKARKKMKKEFTAGDTEDNKTGKTLLDQSAKRKKTKEESALQTISLGSDIENTDKKPKTKKSISEKKYRISHGLPLNEENLHNLLERNKKHLMGSCFIVEDSSGDSVKVDWAGDIVKIIILENNVKIDKMRKTNQRIFEAFKNDTNKDDNVKINENEVFKMFLKNRKK